MKELHGNLPSDLEILLSKGGDTEAKERLVTGDGAFESELQPNQNPSVVVVDTQVTEVTTYLIYIYVSYVFIFAVLLFLM